MRCLDQWALGAENGPASWLFVATRGNYTLSKLASQRTLTTLSRKSLHGIITIRTMPESAQITVGLLALQGDFDAHKKLLEQFTDIACINVRSAVELERIHALILPGGESTTIAKLLIRHGLMQPLQNRIARGMPAYGTCAGMILLAKRIAGLPNQPTIGVLDVTVDRNAFGSQVDSFEADIPMDWPSAIRTTVRGVFIRAPIIQEVGKTVQVLGMFEDRIVAVQQGNILATAFHPELTDDPSIHKYFISMIHQSF